MTVPPNNPNSPTRTWIYANVGYQGDDCITWPFKLNRGYAQLLFEGKGYYAHRMMCELAHGEPPTTKHHAAHSCGNGHKGCLNPRHLSWKTPSENQYDRRKHGTKNNQSGGRLGKLRPDQVAQIRALEGQKSQDEIAAMFGISRPTVRSIFQGKTWKDGKPGLPRLTDEQIRHVQSMKGKVFARVLAKEYNVSLSVIYSIFNGTGQARLLAS